MKNGRSGIPRSHSPSAEVEMHLDKQFVLDELKKPAPDKAVIATK